MAAGGPILVVPDVPLAVRMEGRGARTRARTRCDGAHLPGEHLFVAIRSPPVTEPSLAASSESNPTAILGLRRLESVRSL